MPSLSLYSLYQLLSGAHEKLDLLLSLNQKVDVLMSEADDLTAAVGALATSLGKSNAQIQSELATILSGAQASSMSDADKAAIQASIDKLNTLTAANDAVVTAAVAALTPAVAQVPNAVAATATAAVTDATDTHTEATAS